MNDGSEKPFEATAHRIIKAKREGNVARSGELNANFSFVGAGLTLLGIAPVFGAVACTAIVRSWSGASPIAGVIVAIALLPVAGAGCAGLIVTAVQSGGFAVTALEPKFERLDPLQGFKRICSRETMAHALRAGFAFACATVAMAPFVAWAAPALLQAGAPQGAAAVAWSATRNVCVAACGVGFVFALAEYATARRVWLQRLRMSFDERKRETREQEGDAVARGRRRALHRALLRSGMRRVKDAAFVVTNPSRIAVALEYRPPTVAVPRVLVRAADVVAARVRSIAAVAGIPIIENVWLARALYRDAREGEPIPQAHYVAVAEVVLALLKSKAIAGDPRH